MRVGLDRHPGRDLGSARAVDHRNATGGDREELTRLRRQLSREVPKKTDRNLLIATWNLREFGDLTRKWNSTQSDTPPKRGLRALACIAEVVERFDVIAIQEAQKRLAALLPIADSATAHASLRPRRTAGPDATLRAAFNSWATGEPVLPDSE